MASSVAIEMAARFTGINGRLVIADTIRRLLFVEQTPDVADHLAAAATVECYQPGEILISQGAADTGILFILAGSVIIAPNGRDDIVRSAPAYVGEMATIDPRARRSATIKAKVPTVVARVAEHEFSRIANAHPFVWRHLAIELGERLRQRATKVPLRREKSRIFIASTSEDLQTAKALKRALEADSYDVNIWTDGIFTPGLTNIEALEQELSEADFAILLLSPDDRVFSRWKFFFAPRDNLILELGLFIGAIGRKRAIMVQPQERKLKIPTDLLGVTPIKYPAADMEFVATELRKIFSSLGAK